MSVDRKPDMRVNRARRHFLGVSVATGARLAAIGSLAATFLPSVAQALGTKWWHKDGGGQGGMCFLAGTSIRTAAGEVRIEDLLIGDLVETVDGKAKPIKWIGYHTFRRSGHHWSRSVMPVRIARHALDEKSPHRDLYVSPGHALYIDGVLIQAADLVNGTSITQAVPEGVETLDYFHIAFKAHEGMFAEGVAAESLLLKGGNHEIFANFADYARLYPDEPQPAMVPFAPTVSYGGREHLKALVRLAAPRFSPTYGHARRLYERIAERAE
ncbi:MAG: Hint domain-containing protein, partial [Shinella sp.]|uniref:Hint domain-containing protein n=1 Tax=Shinella sp. TaxID=1870904 RepID=UPI0040356101